MSWRLVVVFLLLAMLLVKESLHAAPIPSSQKGKNSQAKAVPEKGMASPSDSRERAKKILDILVEDQKDFIIFNIIADGIFGNYETFLSTPPKLIIDLKGVTTSYPRRSIKIENPFIKEVRIGKHPDKLRLVFDSRNPQLPPYQINRVKDRLMISFGNISQPSKLKTHVKEDTKVEAKVPPVSEEPKKVLHAKISVEGSLKKPMEDKPFSSNVEQGHPKIEGKAEVIPKAKTKTEESPGEPKKEDEKPIPPMQAPLKEMVTRVGQEAEEPLTLEQSIKIALERNLQLHSAMEGVTGSEFRRKGAITNFLPTWTGQYSYTHYNDPITVGFSGALGGRSTTSRDVFNFNTALQQPLFTGGANSANYRLGRLGVDLSKTNVETVKRDIVLQVRQGYFNILTAERFVEVGRQAVKQFEAQLGVAKAFFEVGIVAKNDVLQAEVRLANARQALVRAENDVALAKASFNTVLRREVNAPLSVVDILAYKPFPLGFEESLQEALRQRPEIKAAQLNIDQAKENVKIAKSGFYPTITLTGGYARASDEPFLGGGVSNDRWTIQTLATFTLWNWGNTAYKVGENKVKVTQAEDAKMQVRDAITLEVKQGYLNMLQAEKNIEVTEKAIEQAQENLRMNEERYKYQVATATDVLDAVVLLAQARVNYYSALGEFNIAKAKLERAMGRMYP